MYNIAIFFQLPTATANIIISHFTWITALDLTCFEEFFFIKKKSNQNVQTLNLHEKRKMLRFMNNLDAISLFSNVYVLCTIHFSC